MVFGVFDSKMIVSSNSHFCFSRSSFCSKKAFARNELSFSGPVHAYSDIFEFATFSFVPYIASLPTHPANSAANPDIFEPAFQSGKKIIHNAQVR